MKKTIITPETIIASRYQINYPLGEGGMGITYEAIDNHVSEKIALKVLSLEKLNDWKTLELFEREAKILSQLNHPSIPRYLDYFQENDNFYLVQQLAPGKSLAVLIKEGWQPQLEDIKHIAQQVLSIIIYLQNLIPPVIHRDIKPENLILNPATGEVFLVDFGAVKDTYQNTVTGGSTVVGTYGYMAPEQFRSQAVLATDLYGLGTTLIFLLTKKHPSDLPQKNLKIDLVSEVKLEKKLASWLNKMIEPIAEDRFLNAQEALEALTGEKEIDSSLKKVSQPRNTPITLIKNQSELIINIPSLLFEKYYIFFSTLLIIYLLKIFGSLLLIVSQFIIFAQRITNGLFLIVFIYLIIIILFTIFLSYFDRLQVIFDNYILVNFKDIYCFVSCYFNQKINFNLSNSQLEFTQELTLPKFNQITLYKIKNNETISQSDKVYLSSIKLPFSQKPFTFCVLELNGKKHRFGLFLTQEENEWLVSELSQFLQL